MRRSRQKRSSTLLFVLSGIFIFAGSRLLKYANENYEILKEADRPMEILSTGLGGFGFFITGVIIGLVALKRALFN